MNTDLKTVDDSFADYRAFCAKRLTRLERYKKAKSFCSLDDETHRLGRARIALQQNRIARLEMTPETPPAFPPPTNIAEEVEENDDVIDVDEDATSEISEFPTPVDEKFGVLKEKMISLMENDVRLLQQLLALGDTIREMREARIPPPAMLQHSSSETSLNSVEDDYEQDQITEDTLTASLSAITRLYVDDEAESSPQPTVIQYFSRQNSVLRIPIPPRSSNRRCQRVPSRPLQRPIPGGRLQLDLGESCHSDCSSSEFSSAQQSPAFTGSARLSNGSIDSGIRADSSPSPPIPEIIKF